ncbi:unnamed protein product, partial [Ectocarpus sp. 13 AM-2016]
GTVAHAPVPTACSVLQRITSGRSRTSVRCPPTEYIGLSPCCSLRTIGSDKARAVVEATGAAKAETAALESCIDPPVVRDRTTLSATTEVTRIQARCLLLVWNSRLVIGLWQPR